MIGLNVRRAKTFFKALCVFLEICNTYLDECYDDDWDGGEWRKLVEDFCEGNGKAAEESFELFKKDYQHLLAGISENKSKKLEGLWRFNELSQ